MIEFKNLFKGENGEKRQARFDSSTDQEKEKILDKDRAEATKRENDEKDIFLHLENATPDDTDSAFELAKKIGLSEERIKELGKETLQKNLSGGGMWFYQEPEIISEIIKRVIKNSNLPEAIMNDPEIKQASLKGFALALRLDKIDQALKIATIAKLPEASTLSIARKVYDEILMESPNPEDPKDLRTKHGPKLMELANKIKEQFNLLIESKE